MKSMMIAAMALTGSLTASACAGWPTTRPIARAECAPQSDTIYYSYQADDLDASAEPIIHRIAERVAACRAAGGELTRITITAFPNRTDTTVGGDQTAQVRGRAVFDALVAAGLPAKRIKLTNYRRELDNPNQIMRRRAEISTEQR